MKKSKTPTLALAVSGTLLSGLTVTAVNAETSSEMETSPFEISELSAGYMQTAQTGSEKEEGAGKMKDGTCGEGKCGSAMMKGSEEKTSEGKCAGNKPMPKANKKNKNMEGKCGEGKCGSSM